LPAAAELGLSRHPPLQQLLDQTPLVSWRPWHHPLKKIHCWFDRQLPPAPMELPASPFSTHQHRSSFSKKARTRAPGDGSSERCPYWPSHVD
jgi:hypothetical protein